MNIRADLAQHIRHVDGDNDLDAEDLGLAISEHIGGMHVDINDVINFVAETNYNKTMCASSLADAIVDHFQLDTENGGASGGLQR